MKTRRELAQEQLDLMNDIRAKANINIVTCGHCGTILLHEMNEEDIECFGCKRILDQSDCPDLWYEGCQNSSEFDEDPPKVTNEISIEDVVNVAERLGMNPSIEEINEVMVQYDSEAENDPTATWDLIVENLLYNNVAPRG
jgi:hypothetical protein